MGFTVYAGASPVIKAVIPEYKKKESVAGMNYRVEHDSMGEMKVPADRLWAAQTQRSHENFEIGVGIERCGNFLMTQYFLNRFDIHATLKRDCGETMTQLVRGARNACLLLVCANGKIKLRSCVWLFSVF